MIPIQIKYKNAKIWIGKQPISVSNSSKLLQALIFLCKKDPKALIVSFVAALEELANKSKAEMLEKFPSIENTIKTRKKTIFKNLNEPKIKTLQSLNLKKLSKKELICPLNSSKFREINFSIYINVLNAMLKFNLNLAVFGLTVDNMM